MVKKSYFKVRKCCPLCLSQNIQIIFSKTFNEIRTKQFFKKHLNSKFPMNILNHYNYIICECKKCKFIFQKNTLNEKLNSKLYDDFIDHQKILKRKNFDKDHLENNIQEFDLIDRIFKDKKISILEYGAGLGGWISALKVSGYKNIDAVEISQKRRNFLKKLKIKATPNLSNLKKKYDLIYSDQTFEHLIYPEKEIKRLIKHLKIGGYLIFKIPPGNNFKKKLKKNYIAQKDEGTPLEHINIYSLKSLDFIKERYKLSSVKYYKYYKIYELNFIKNILSYIYHKFSGKKLILRKT